MLNLNTQPYYDDFDDTKNYHRILFKPGVAVQARELTQAQTILQDQISKFGRFVLSDGSNVTGGKPVLDYNAKSLNLANVGSIATDIENFTGKYVVGETSKCISVITSSDILNYYLIVKTISGGENNYEQGENLRIFSTLDLAHQYRYNDAIQGDYTAKMNTFTPTTVAGCNGQKDSYTFTIPTSSYSVQSGDVISTSSDTNTRYVVTELNADGTFSVHQPLVQDYINTSLIITREASNVVLEVGFEEGVYFTNGIFVKALPQSIIPNPNTKYPSCIVGYEVIETVLDYIDDSSLLDPSQGSYNYTAPGADRYKIYLNLVSKPILYGALDQTSLTDSSFIELLRIQNGKIVYNGTDPTLGGLQDILAKQMYDHAGNFIISPFNISFNESDFGNIQSKLKCSVSAGKAYVYGYPFNSTFPSHFNVDKARNTESFPDASNYTHYGNSIKISDVTGALPIPQTGTRIELHSASIGATSSSTLLGYADVRNIDYTTTNEYDLYLYNIGVSETKLATVNSIKGAAFSANTILTNGQNVVSGAKYNSLLFSLPYSNPASITNAKITLDKFSTLSVSSGVTTILSGSLNTQFAASSVAVTDLDLASKLQNFIIVAKSAYNGNPAGNYIDLNDVIIKIEALDTQYKATFTFRNTYANYNAQIDIKYSFNYINATQKTKTLHQNKVVQLTCTTAPKSIGFADVIAFKGVYKTTVNNADYIGVYTPGLTYFKNQVVYKDGKLYLATVDPSSAPGSGTDWSELPNTISNYKLDNGQKEFMYDHGQISAINTTYTGKVFVVFDYYSHSTDGQYIAFNSYSSINYNQIPTVNINNVSYDLKNYVDFRPRRKDCSEPVNIDNGDTLSSIKYDTYAVPSTIDINNKFTYNMTYYLGRIDKLVLSSERKLEWLPGTPSYKNYIPPKDLPNAMTIALIQFDPYTPNAKSIKITYSKHRRYTMDDIGNLDTRLQNVEYYTALTMGEKATLSTNVVDEYGTRLKNGFIVDAFTNFNICDLTEDSHFCLDLKQNTAKPRVIPQDYAVTYTCPDLYDGRGALDSGLSHKYVQFPSKPKVLYTQDSATGTVKVNQFDCIQYKGNLFLNPQTASAFNQFNNTTINNIDENTAAIMDISAAPGGVSGIASSVFDSWQLIYPTDKTVLDDKTSTTVNYNNTSYTVSTKLVQQGQPTVIDTVKDLTEAPIKPVSIKFKATGLAPLQRMFVFVNNRMVNAYVKPDNNPLGIITSVHITEKGAGYGSSTTAALSNIAGTSQAAFSVLVKDGNVDNIQISNYGLGYAYDANYGDQNDLSLTFTSPGATITKTAKAVASLVPDFGTYLYTDIHGECTGTLNIPYVKGLIEFTGNLDITICDNPHPDIENNTSIAKATFYGKIEVHNVATTINSIRLPNIVEVSKTPTLAASLQKKVIVVPTSVNYLTKYYDQDYDAKTKIGSLSIPISLSQAPSSAVTVTYGINYASKNINSSEDQSANTTITSLNAQSFTFTTENWNAPQTLTIGYNLGDRQSYTENGKTKYIDNQLPSHIEFYASSSDPEYSCPPTAIPMKSWLKDGLVTGVSSTQLVPYQVYDPADVDLEDGLTPFIHVSPVQISNVGGQSFFTVTYGGGKDIGWWANPDKATPARQSPYPLIFTATPNTESDAQVIVINSSEYTYNEISDKRSTNVREIKSKNENAILSFKYWLYGKTTGSANVKLTVSSPNNDWNSAINTSLVKLIPVTVGPSLLAPNPAIIVHDNVQLTADAGAIEQTGVRETASKGTTSIIGITLSKAPTSTVTVKANSDVIVGGGDIYNVSNDGTNISSGNTVTFTTSTWDQMKTIYVTGTNNPLNTTDEKVSYNVYLTASSSDSNFNTLQQKVPLVNYDAKDAQGGYDIILPKNQLTSGNGSSVLLSVTLKKAPTNGEKVRVAVGVKETGDSVGKGGYIATTSIYGANGILQFDISNWNTPQPVKLTGQKLEGLDEGKEIPYKVTAESYEWDLVKASKVEPSIWKQYGEYDFNNATYKYSTETITTITSETTYAAIPLGRSPEKWYPNFTISTPTIMVHNGTYEAANTKVELILASGQTAPEASNSLKLRIRAKLKSGTGGSDTKITKIASANVSFTLTRANNDCYISKTCTIMAPTQVIDKGGTTGTKIVQDLTNHQKDHTYIIPSATLDGPTRVDVSFEGLKLTQMTDVYCDVTIDGIYYDAYSPGFKVTKTDTHTEHVRTFRSDNYSDITNPATQNVTTDPITSVITENWSTAGWEAVAACAKAIKNWQTEYKSTKWFVPVTPVPDDPAANLLKSSVGYAATALTLTRKRNDAINNLNIQQKLVDKINNQILLLGDSVGSDIQRAQIHETKVLADLQAEVNSLGLQYQTNADDSMNTQKV